MSKNKRDLQLQVEIQEGNIKILIDDNITLTGKNMKLECENTILKKRIKNLEQLADKKIKAILNDKVDFTMLQVNIIR